MLGCGDDTSFSPPGSAGSSCSLSQVSSCKPVYREGHFLHSDIFPHFLERTAQKLSFDELF